MVAVTVGGYASGPALGAGCGAVDGRELHVANTGIGHRLVLVRLSGAGIVALDISEFGELT